MICWCWVSAKLVKEDALKSAFEYFLSLTFYELRKCSKKKTTFCHTWEITLKDDMLSFPMDVYEQDKLYFFQDAVSIINLKQKKTHSSQPRNKVLSNIVQ